MIFFTSDIHFGQQSLLATGKWKERPFKYPWRYRLTGIPKHARGAYRTAERPKASYCRQP